MRRGSAAGAMPEQQNATRAADNGRRNKRDLRIGAGGRIVEVFWCLADVRRVAELSALIDEVM